MAEERRGSVLRLRSLPVPAADGYSRTLSSPIPIHIEFSDGEYIVSDSELLYGHGRSLTEALEDYGATILDYYEMLIEREELETLGSNERAHLDLLDGLLNLQVTSAQIG